MTGHTNLPNDVYQEVANEVCAEVYRMLHMLHASLEPITGTGDGAGNAGPLVQGALGALLQFAMESGRDDGVLRTQIIQAIDSMMPQYRMAYEADRLGAGGVQGNA